MTKFETFGERLVRAQRIREMDFRRLRQETGLMAQSLVAYESGRTLPSYGSLRAIARALDMSADYLAGVNEVPRRLENREPDFDAFSQRLLLERAKRNWTQDQMASLLDTDRKKVSGWERANSPAYWALLEAGKRLNVSIDWLCGFSNRVRYDD